MHKHFEIVKMIYTILLLLNLTKTLYNILKKIKSFEKMPVIYYKNN